MYVYCFFFSNPKAIYDNEERARDSDDKKTAASLAPTRDLVFRRATIL